VAYEAADAGLLSPELAAGIRRVKGVRRLGVRLGNWLTPEQARRLLEYPEPATPRQLRDYAMLAMLIGCGLRRGELLTLKLKSIQQREQHWVVADLVGKKGHIPGYSPPAPGDGPGGNLANPIRSGVIGVLDPEESDPAGSRL
jgi:integrase